MQPYKQVNYSTHESDLINWFNNWGNAVVIDTATFAKPFHVARYQVPISFCYRTGEKLYFVIMTGKTSEMLDNLKLLLSLFTNITDSPIQNS